MGKLRKNKGITLIALVITIIVLLILAGVTIATLTGDNGILNQANKAKTETTKASAKEQVEVEVLGSYGADGNLDNGLLKTNLNNIKGITGVPDLITDSDYPLTVNVDGYDIVIKKDGTVSFAFDSAEWDKTATAEDCFIWKSDDPNNEGYGTVIGYTEKIENYTVLRFPSRCTEITFSNNLDYNGVTTTTSRAFTNNILVVEIPGTVTSIGSYAFGHPNNNQSFTALEKVVMEYGVKSTGYYAFQNCSSLTNIEIPDSVTNIESLAFSECTSLSNITIPSSVTSIGDSAFQYCRSLTSITIPGSVTSIGNGAFSRCTSLSNIQIPSSVTSIGSGAFSDCTSLSSIQIPSSVTSIGSGAFSGCTSLSSIQIPSSVTSIGSNAFNNTIWYNNQPDGLIYAGEVAYKYKGIMPSNTNIQIREGAKGIGGSAFYGYTGLSSITIPSSVTSIGDSAFYGCTSLSNITIPSSVTNIGGNAFFNCTNLSSIIIPNSVTTIGNSAFYGWTSNQTINIQGYSSAASGWEIYWNSNCSATINWNQ
ncbi:MAG: leucine-rich repeat protein [Clostridia bacterium]